jgi:hypothetical protein
MSRLLLTALTLTSAAVFQLAAGCSQSAVRGKAGASAPTLTAEGQAHIRGVSDPNAPFTLVDRSSTASRQNSRPGDEAALPCQPSDLQIYEAGAAMKGSNRVLTLAIKNRSTASCRLSGYPAIELHDENGGTVATIAVHQTGALELSGSVVSAAKEVSTTAEVTKAEDTSQKFDLILRPSTAGTFQLGWTSGDECPVVSSFTVALAPSHSDIPGSVLTGSFTISHSLNVCNGEIRVTSLTLGGSV